MDQSTNIEEKRLSRLGSIELQEIDKQHLELNLGPSRSHELLYVAKGEGDWQMGSAVGTLASGSLLFVPAQIQQSRWAGEFAAMASL